MKLGIIREEKTPGDSRVPLTPVQVVDLLKKYPEVEIKVQHSDVRAYADAEYTEMGIEVVEDVSECDVLLGVKEVPVNSLIPGKTYFFFSHTIKEQAYNKRLLQAILEKNIRLLDYETLVNDDGVRLVGFGRYAGIVGAHHALLMWGKKKGLFNIKPANKCRDYLEMVEQYSGLDYGTVKIFITGNGRVSRGSVEVLKNAGIREVNVDDYLHRDFREAVFVQCDMDELYMPHDGNDFDFHYFFHHPEKFSCNFKRFLPETDILINGMFWDPRADVLFTKEDVISSPFNIRIISDISCDINGSVPLTYKATTIDNPYYGVDPRSLEEIDAFTGDSIDMMTVDNLPNELPRDASEMFGDVMMHQILPLLFKNRHHPVLDNATIAENGELTPKYSYLKDFAGVK